ncbi:MAG: hypothetical protein ACI9LL_001097 [Porticoccus sp.]
MFSRRKKWAQKFREFIYSSKKFNQWIGKYQDRIGLEGAGNSAKKGKMMNSNPNGVKK